ncbi:thiolase family protein [Streptomyces montanus]|uniref:Thiolase family protein n=1 Tax=Streptomyces montanus TaxID=2580423 RepID=A0A5R9G0E0_9ACTN|nr:thiolase family protein [Streptomyces montanus]TLS46988.1 thiolase family protein [Streptomyces montanus]
MARSDDVYVVGCGMHPFGRDASVTGMDMAEHAVREALRDAGVGWADIGYAAGGSDVSGKPDTLVGRLGLTGVPFVNVQGGCATGASTVLAVANALRAGEATLGLAVGFDKHERGAFHVSAARYGLGDWYAETGMMLTTQFFALKTQRYLHEYGISERALAMVAARAFRNGSHHPMAWRRKPLTEQEILDSAEVSPPLTQYMFCSPGQGAVALVLARGDRAFDLCERPVRLASVALRTRRFGSFEVFSPWLPPGPHRSPSVDAAEAVFRGADVRPADVRVAQLQDTDSGSELIHLAETGLCGHGEQEELLASGDTDPTGRLPVNTDGGCLAGGEPVGASGLRQFHEVVRQLQGRAAGVQVPGAPRVGFTHVYGAPGISACSVLTI